VLIIKKIDTTVLSLRNSSLDKVGNLLASVPVVIPIWGLLIIPTIDWLKDHILQMDKKYQAKMNANGIR
jgi:hypothetical protein